MTPYSALLEQVATVTESLSCLVNATTLGRCYSVHYQQARHLSTDSLSDDK